MAVTAKKKLELKTAKTVPAGRADGMGADAQSSVSMPMPFAPQEKTPSYVFYGILGILAFLMFGALVFIQWIEWDEYTNQPGLNFPLLTAEAFTETPSAPSAPAETPADDGAAGGADAVQAEVEASADFTE